MCFSLLWFQQLIILVVVICAIVSILKIVIPYALSKMGATIGEGLNVVIACFRVVLWAVVVIFVVVIAFALISCLWSYAGGFPILHGR